MSFTDMAGLSNGPERKCPEKFGGLLAVFKPGVLEGHERAGYVFRPRACLSVIAYDPDFCQPGDIKMDPGAYGPGKEAILGMIQTAIVCSSIGATMDELREEARDALADKLGRAIDSDFIAELALLAVSQTPTALQAKCALAEAAQFLSNSSECGRGLIVGPINWFEQLENTLVWNNAKGFHTDFVGNIVIPHSVDNSTVYALDMAVEIKVSEILILDELSPAVTTVNDRIVRAEQLFSIAIDSCSVGSFDVSDCCPCTSGGGGGTGTPSTSVDDEALCDDNGIFFRRVTDNGAGVRTVSFVNVAGAPYVPVGTIISCGGSGSNGVDIEDVLLCDTVGGQIVATTMAVYTYDADTGLPVGPPTFVVPGTNTPYVPIGIIQACDNATQNTIVEAHHRLVGAADAPWTVGTDVVGTLTSVTFAVLTGTATVTDFNGDVAAGLPAGLSTTWKTDPDTSGSLSGPQSIDAVGGSTYVTWTERV